PTETPAVNNGDILAFNAQITPLTGDEVPADNVFVYNQTVVGSFDPNDIYCLEGSSLDPSMIGNYLHYNVRFENTGTAAAENIVVATTINPAEYDLSSLQVMNASHNVYTRLNGNLVEFIFENIQLAGSPSGGHGHVLFKMKSNPNVQTTGHVTSNANIFFDYNFPIETNDATTVFETLRTNDNDAITVQIYPNPTKDQLHIQSQEAIKKLDWYDIGGRILESISVDAKEVHQDLSQRASGIYFVKLKTEKGSKTLKIIKE
ncbi:T9SS type A sorting domain-containing protein, partial [Flavobacterium branchiophilum]